MDVRRGQGTGDDRPLVALPLGERIAHAEVAVDRVAAVGPRHGVVGGAGRFAGYAVDVEHVPVRRLQCAHVVAVEIQQVRVAEIGGERVGAEEVGRARRDHERVARPDGFAERNVERGGTVAIDDERVIRQREALDAGVVEFDVVRALRGRVVHDLADQDHRVQAGNGVDEMDVGEDAKMIGRVGARARRQGRPVLRQASARIAQGVIDLADGRAVRAVHHFVAVVEVVQPPSRRGIGGGRVGAFLEDVELPHLDLRGFIRRVQLVFHGERDIRAERVVGREPAGKAVEVRRLAAGHVLVEVAHDHVFRVERVGRDPRGDVRHRAHELDRAAKLVDAGRGRFVVDGVRAEQVERAGDGDLDVQGPARHFLRADRFLDLARAGDGIAAEEADLERAGIRAAGPEREIGIAQLRGQRDPVVVVTGIQLLEPDDIGVDALQDGLDRIVVGVAGRSDAEIDVERRDADLHRPGGKRRAEKNREEKEIECNTPSPAAIETHRLYVHTTLNRTTSP